MILLDVGGAMQIGKLFLGNIVSRSYVIVEAILSYW